MANNQEFKVNKSIEAASYQDKLGTSTQVVNGFDLTAYNISQSTLVLDSQLSTGQYNRGFTFNDTGTRMFVCNNEDDILAYEMDTPYDYVNATYSSSLSVTGLSGLTQGTCIRFSDAESGKAYILDYSADTIKQYSLSTMYDMSTATQDTSDTLNTYSEDNAIFSFFFNSDGTKLYAVGRETPGQSIYQYDLTTAWDLSTASYASKSLDISAKAPSANGGVMSSDGKKVILGDNSNDKLVMYTLSTAYDISTGTFTNETPVPSGVTCVGIEVDPTGTRLFFSDGTGSGTGEIRSYDIGSIDIELDLSTGTVFEHRPKDVFYANIKPVNPPASGTLSSATLILHGGTRDSYNLDRINVDNVAIDITPNISSDFYMTGIAINNSNDEITVASTRYNYFGRFNTFKNNDDGSRELLRTFAASTPYSHTGESDIAFSRDGKWFYWQNYYRAQFYWVNLDEPFNIAENNWITNSSRSLSGDENGLEINPDGTRLYSSDADSRRIYIYDLEYTGDRYDPSTLSSVSPYFVTLGNVDSTVFDTDSRAYYLKFSKDGRYLFISERNNGQKRIIRLVLTSPYEINEDMTVDQIIDDWEDLTTYSSATDLFAFPIDFNEAGTKMYATYGIRTSGGSNLCYIERYTVGTAIDYITYDSSIKWAGGTAPTMPNVDETAVYVFNTSDGGTTYNASVAMDGVTGVEQ